MNTISDITTLSADEFAHLGQGDIAYVKPIKSDEVGRLFPQAPEIQPRPRPLHAARRRRRPDPADRFDRRGRGERLGEQAPDGQPALSHDPETGSGASGPRAFAVDDAAAGERLDKFLAARFAAQPDGLSRSRIQALIAAGHVTVDGRAAAASVRLSAGSAVAIVIPAPIEAEPVGQAIPLSIVFEDPHLLVLDKPAGLVVHPAPGHDDGTLVNALIAHCGDSLSGIGGVRRPGIVHRLDRDTSGLMAVAKTDAAHRGLAELFADHGRSGSLDRTYTAFAWGSPAAGTGSVDKPLGRHAQHREKMAVVPAARGRHAVTHWTREREYLGLACRLTCRLETGRTHQIRVHMTEIGLPLIGDPVYGTGFRTKAARLPEAARDAVAALGRQALHAAVLGFEHPVTGAVLRFASALPDDLRRLEAALLADDPTG